MERRLWRALPCSGYNSKKSLLSSESKGSFLNLTSHKGKRMLELEQWAIFSCGSLLLASVKCEECRCWICVCLGVSTEG